MDSNPPVFLLAKGSILQYTGINMKAETFQKLLQINRQFYDRFAPSFSVTRGQVQPGVLRLSERFVKEAFILDVGCGNGTLARSLISQGFSGNYLGVDMSEGLLTAAKRLTDETQNAEITFRWADLAVPDWPNQINRENYDWLVSFAVLHHIPGENLRQKTIANFRKLIKPDGRVAVSVWQWQNSARLRKRVLPWSAVGIDPEEVDEGDVLLDWRAGDIPGIRYVHTFSDESLTKLAREAGFKVAEVFYSDGKSGDLALYQVWK